MPKRPLCPRGSEHGSLGRAEQSVTPAFPAQPPRLPPASFGDALSTRLGCPYPSGSESFLFSSEHATALQRPAQTPAPANISPHTDQCSGVVSALTCSLRPCPAQLPCPRPSTQVPVSLELAAAVGGSGPSSPPQGPILQPSSKPTPLETMKFPGQTLSAAQALVRLSAGLPA